MTKYNLNNLKKYSSHMKDLELDVLATLAFSTLYHKISLLEEEDFYRSDTKNIFLKFRETYNKKGLIDASLIDGIDYSLLANRNLVTTSSQLDARIGKLKELSAKRKIAKIIYNTQTMIDENRDLDMIKNFTISELEKIKEEKEETLDEIDKQFVDMLERPEDLSVMSGYSKLDFSTGGFRNGTLNIIAAAQGIGKTTIAAIMAYNILKQGKKVLFVTVEMTKKDLFAKMISYLTGISYIEILKGRLRKDKDWVKFDTKEWKIINSAREKIIKSNLILFGEKELTTLDIKSKITEAGNFNIVFIDYLQELKPVAEYKTLYVKVSNIASELKSIALETDIPLVVVSSINRDYSDRKDFKPHISDIRESGRVEYVADMILLLHRESIFRDAKISENIEEFKHKGEIIIAKNRYGESNLSIDLYVDGFRSLISEAEEQLKIGD